MELVDENTAKELVSIEQAIIVVEGAFAELAHGRAQVFPVTQGHGADPDCRVSVKMGLLDEQRSCGIKLGTYWPRNRRAGLPNHGSTTLLLDNETGFPKALVSASYLNALRTAAANGVAVKFLARAEADVLALVGAGHQAWFELLAVHAVRPLRHIRIWNRDDSRAKAMALRVRKELGVEAECLPLSRALAGADIVVTVTATRDPLIRAEWIGGGTHISAMGADGPGKQELDTDLMSRSRLFADSIAQSIGIGELKAAISEGVIDAGDITPIGAVVSGLANGRMTGEEITIFDSSGIALQDLAIAEFALGAARAAGRTGRFDLGHEIGR